MVPSEEREVGVVEDYFGNIGVAAVQLSRPLKVGDRIHIQGHTTDFETEVESIQIEHQPVESARRGDSVGLKVPQKCRKHDRVTLVAP